MKQPHKHAALIKAWADGAAVQFRDPPHAPEWTDISKPTWLPYMEYRIKPEPVVVRLAVLPRTCMLSPLYIGLLPAQKLKLDCAAYDLVFDVIDDVPSNPRFEEVKK